MKLEFNVKSYLDYDEDVINDLLGNDPELLNMRIDDYYEMEREDLAESLSAEFGISVYGYDGRSGGYILLEDYEEYLFRGTKAGEISLWDNDNYGEPVDDVMEYRDNLDEAILSLTEQGPLGEFWDDYLVDLEEMLDEGSEYDVDIAKNATKIIAKNYNKLDSFISKAVDGFGSGFEEFVRDMVENN
jgi:hypothetical protein